MNSDIIFLGSEPEGRVFVGDADMAWIYRRSDPQRFFKIAPGNWVWEGHCGQFKCGTVRPPWLNEEWQRRVDAGDKSYGDASTYDPREVRE